MPELILALTIVLAAILPAAAQGYQGQVSTSFQPAASSAPPPGQYELTNMDTGRTMMITIDADGKVLTDDSPPLQPSPTQSAYAAGYGQYAPAAYPAYSSPYQYAPYASAYNQYPAYATAQPAQTAAAQPAQAATAPAASAPASQDNAAKPSKWNIVGNALKGALGLYYNYKYGGMTGGYSPYGYGGYYPSSFATSGSSGFGSLLHSIF